MKHRSLLPLSRRRILRYMCATIMALLCALPLCGFIGRFASSTAWQPVIKVFAAEEGSPDLTRTATPAATASLPPTPENTRDELFPADVQTVIDGGTRQIVKTYVLAPGQSPADIPRDSFTRSGWRYTLTDVTEKRTSVTDVKAHTETVTIGTDSKDLNAIIQQLSPTLDYQSDDGYAGVLTVDLASVKCEEAGTKTSSYTVSATREYPHLSNPDLSLIPKTITDSGRTLYLEDVSWEAQNTVSVDYEDVPESYRAIAIYKGTGSKTVVTGYVTTADYTGEIARTVTGDTVYTAYFLGAEINPTPAPTATPMPTATPTPSPSATPAPTETPEPSETLESSETASPGVAEKPAAPNSLGAGSVPVLPIAIGVAALAALGGAGAFWLFRRNVRIYRDGFRILAAKDRLTAKKPVIDLTPLDGGCFGLVIDRYTAKALNGVTIEVRNGETCLRHKIAYEGNAYKIEADFGAGNIQAIY